MPIRMAITVIGLFTLLVGIWLRMIDLVTFDRPFLMQQSQVRTNRVETVPAYRGMITDRQGSPLAVTTKVESIWINPQKIGWTPSQCQQLAGYLQTTCRALKQRVSKQKNQFYYLKRHLAPQDAQAIRALEIEGLSSQTEYKRFYPEGAATAPLLGFTNIDDQGQEGLELAYNRWLAGKVGKIRVEKDRLGHILSDPEVLAIAQKGQTLQLALDHQLQYIAYKALADMVESSHAKSGSVIVLGVPTAEILAMVNFPSFNPNVRKTTTSALRNRAILDLFEPGSTMKIFSTVAILEQLGAKADQPIAVKKKLMIEGRTIQDIGHHPEGLLHLRDILKVSSNVGIATAVFSLPSGSLQSVLQRFGFTSRLFSGFPGERSGQLSEASQLHQFDLGTLSFGYGMSTSLMHLAHGLFILANQGKDGSLSFVKVVKPSTGPSIVSPKIAQKTLQLLEGVTQKDGTGHLAAISGVRVAGKTGTSHKAQANGYAKDQYIASFVGAAPLNAPKFVVAVMIDEPDHQHHFGGQSAAVVFQKVMAQALRQVNA